MKYARGFFIEASHYPRATVVWYQQVSGEKRLILLLNRVLSIWVLNIWVLNI